MPGSLKVTAGQVWRTVHLAATAEQPHQLVMLGAHSLYPLKHHVGAAAHAAAVVGAAAAQGPHLLRKGRGSHPWMSMSGADSPEAPAR